ncbi:MAG: hypothetical protein JRH07_01825, partial [Deltaproteobacteria bacterium]|nr:hypothetical protein [Deltaproteobacteria bacterium]
FDHREPFYVYLIHLPTLLLPWSPLFLVGVTSAIFTVRWRRLGAHTQWLAASATLVFVMFTASGSRRIYYILPMLPFCALFLGLFLAGPGRERWKQVGLGIQGLLFVGLAALEAVTPVVWPLAKRYVGTELPASLIAGTGLVGLLGLAPWLFHSRLSGPIERITGMRGRIAPLMVTVVFLMGGFFCFQKVTLECFATTPDFARRLASTGRRADEIAFFEESRTDVIFYMNCQVPSPVLSGRDEIVRFLESRGERGVIILPVGDLDRLRAMLPEGAQGDSVVVERSSPWLDDPSELLVAWRLKSKAGTASPRECSPKAGGS